VCPDAPVPTVAERRSIVRRSPSCTAEEIWSTQATTLSGNDAGARRSPWSWRRTDGSVCGHQATIAGWTASISRSTRPAIWSSPSAAKSSPSSVERCFSSSSRQHSSWRSGVRATGTAPPSPSGGSDKTAGTFRCTSKTLERRSSPWLAAESTTGRSCWTNGAGWSGTRRSAGRSSSWASCSTGPLW
jgi:hypothetical protein